ncbi:MAG: lytic transglycosylase domain-containing protein [Bacteroidia bacterium]|nr:lytic transglycosylase domain-containing protein [Bacteroidia bacterium]
MKFSRRRAVFRRRNLILALTLPGVMTLCLLLERWFHPRDTAIEQDSNHRTSAIHFGVRLPSDINFCGEPFPKDDSVIVNRLARELGKKSLHIPQYNLFLIRCATWFPVIEPILRQHGIPDDMKYVALVESNLSNVISPKGAAGFWQFIPESGERMGLEVNEYVDERYHVEKSTAAACRYLKELYNTFHSWTLAAAAYNLGEGGILRQIRNQPGRSLYELKLNKETSIYIYKLLSVKEVISRPRFYGILKRSGAQRISIPYKEKKVDQSIEDLELWAREQGTSPEVIYHLNPWLMRNQLPNHEGNTYRIRVPDGRYSEEKLKELFKPDPISPSEDSSKLSNFAHPDTTGKIE